MIMNQLNLSAFQNKLKTEKFEPKYSSQLESEIGQKILKISNKDYNFDFNNFLEVVLSALENRNNDYMKLIEGLEKKELNNYTEIFGILLNYFLDGNYGDPLGRFYMQSGLNRGNGEFYTPFHISLVMAEMTNPKPQDKCCDPCVGSGNMLLAVRYVIHKNYGWMQSSIYGKNLYGMDISSNAVKMSKIQIYLTDYLFIINRFIEATNKIKEMNKNE